MAYNKVIYDGNTLIDLTADTATEPAVVEGETFHRADGVRVTGTLVVYTEGYYLANEESEDLTDENNEAFLIKQVDEL